MNGLNDFSPACAASEANLQSLPRLLYLGEVPVEAYVHGSTLLYRLFETYPRQKLLVVECLRASSVERRVKGVQYELVKPRWSRLLENRLNAYISPVAGLAVPLWSESIAQVVNGFQPEAVITVAVGHFWKAAAQYANCARVPLHLIVHDDWPNDPTRTRLERWWAEQSFRRWYPAASSRLCVSPYMADEFLRRYGAPGDVLYPSRASNSIAFETPPQSLSGRCEPFTVAFAGTIYLEYARGLQRLAAALGKLGGKLLVFGPKPYEAVNEFLAASNIEMRGLVSSFELIQSCRNQAHALYIPMSYRPGDQHNMEISFPSKLADSTAIGLPLIIDGPPYSSAIRWAHSNPNVAEIVGSETEEALMQSLVRLRDTSHRVNLAKEAISRGREYFAHDRAIDLLSKRLSTSHLLPTS